MEPKSIQVQSSQMQKFRMPAEDIFEVDQGRGLITVVDGKRFDKIGSGFYKKGWNFRRNARNQPKTDGASQCAATVCPRIQNSLEVECDSYGLILKTDLLESFDDANRAIREFMPMWSLDLNFPDFSTDYPGCDAAAVAIFKDRMQIGYIGGCGIALIDENGRLLKKTVDNGFEQTFLGYYGNGKEGLRKLHSASQRTEFRRMNRNQPSMRHGYGVLNGQPSAYHFIQTEGWDYIPSNRVLVYTGGSQEIIFDEKGNLRPAFLERFMPRDHEALKEFFQSQVREEAALVYT